MHERRAAPAPRLGLALEALEAHGALLTELAEEIARTNPPERTSQELQGVGAEIVSVVSRLMLAHQMIDGLLLCARHRRMASAEALGRPVWEALLNANYSLVCGPAANLEAIHFETKRVTEVDVDTGQPWPPSKEERMSSKAKLDALRADAQWGTAHEALEKTRRFLHKDASSLLHGNLYGALGHITRAARTVEGMPLADWEVEHTVMWLALAVDATLGAVARKHLPDSKTVAASRTHLLRMMDGTGNAVDPRNEQVRRPAD